MIVFERGQQLTKDDLNIYIRDDVGNLVDPYSITYSIYDKTGSKPVLVGNSLDQIPTRQSVGYYWANIRIDDMDNLGEYEICWNYKATEASDKEASKQRFSIIKKADPLQVVSGTGGVAYYPGQILGQTELFINILNERNNPFDPDEITYAVFDRTTGLEILKGSPANTPVRLSVGKYYANYTVPQDAATGDYVIRWSFKGSSDSSVRNVVQEFAVVAPGTSINSLYTDQERGLIRQLRFLLRDNNPDRNYRFVPPEHQKVIQNYTETFGFIWTDEELFEYLVMAIDAVNNYPPLENYNTTNLPNHLRTLVILKAGSLALAALAVNWIHDEFDYSIGGVSLQIEKSQKYQGMGEQFENQYQTALDRYKDFGIKITRGVQQPKYGIGISAALGPFSGFGVQNRRNFISSNRV